MCQLILEFHPGSGIRPKGAAFSRMARIHPFFLDLRFSPCRHRRDRGHQAPAPHTGALLWKESGIGCEGASAQWSARGTPGAHFLVIRKISRDNWDSIYMLSMRQKKDSTKSINGFRRLKRNLARSGKCVRGPSGISEKFQGKRPHPAGSGATPTK
jgi:hypothetical protein